MGRKLRGNSDRRSSGTRRGRTTSERGRSRVRRSRDRTVGGSRPRRREPLRRRRERSRDRSRVGGRSRSRGRRWNNYSLHASQESATRPRRRYRASQRDRERGTAYSERRKRRSRSRSRQRDRDRPRPTSPGNTNLLLHSILEKLTSEKKEERPRAWEVESGHVEDLYRKDLIDAVRRLPEGDAWKAKIMATVKIPNTSTATTQAGAQKATRENFRR